MWLIRTDIKDTILYCYIIVISDILLLQSKELLSVSDHNRPRLNYTICINRVELIY